MNRGSRRAPRHPPDGFQEGVVQFSQVVAVQIQAGEVVRQVRLVHSGNVIARQVQVVEGRGVEDLGREVRGRLQVVVRQGQPDLSKEPRVI